MVINRNGKGDFCQLLPDNILVQNISDFAGGRDDIGHVGHGLLAGQLTVIQNVHAQMHAFITYISARTRNDTGDLLLMLPAKGAAHRLALVSFGHKKSPFSARLRKPPYSLQGSGENYPRSHKLIVSR
ncbi:hypothetical protein SDC9_164802 [bioreactor metagenome]|uniref:Uncharacterized protein n=1 Tax=bioreactor metagenome TaxID=1076179 RepID=A0A645FV89_9ZZZZ